MLVAAPTGSGKTLVGEFAVHLALHTGRKCFYTTPIKALSNQKYHDLVDRYGPERVGLLTLCLFAGDREDLTEVAGNLLDNAFKWSRGRVRMTAERISDPTARRDGLRLVVEDDGPGIPVDERNHVLDRGARLDERVSGQGIGLSVVRELAQLNGGTIRIDESPLGGALIEIRFPAT